MEARLEESHTPANPPRPAPKDDQYYDGAFAEPARWLLRRGVHPNHLTFLQLPVFILQIVATFQEWRLAFALLIALVVLLDAGDGILARVGRLQTKSGAVLDSTFDTLGIAIVMWGAAQFEPEYASWLMILFLANIVLFLQNALLEEKVIGYLRGPIVIGVAVPEVMAAGVLIPAVTTLALLVWRTPNTVRALAKKAPLDF